MTAQFVTYTPTARQAGASSSHRRHPPVGRRQRGHCRTRHAPGGRTGHRRDRCSTTPAAPGGSQLAAFRAQLALARERRLPVVLHCVRAFEPVMLELAAREPRAVIFHGFIGSPEQARRALEKGYYLSFGVRTFSSPKTMEALRETPPGQLFLETDDSDTGIEEVYAHAAAVRGTTVEALKRATTENYERIFAPQNG